MTVRQIADQLLRDLAPVDPAAADALGREPDNVMPALSPEDFAARHRAHLRALQALTAAGKPAADLSRELTARWHDRLRPIFEQQIDEEAVFLKMSTSSPEGVPEWDNEPRVTLIGDAVHNMTPAGGVGANTALRDSALLGRLLAAAGGVREGLTAEYEREMRVYASGNVKMSFEMASRMFNITELTKTL